MKYLAIKSVGEIEPEAISLMGASTKRGDKSKIGMFGSGNKFALAYLIRSGAAPHIFSGMKAIPIGTRERVFRGETFTTITVDGCDTSLTTTMGKDWTCWMAIREIYANALDEGEAHIGITEKMSPAPGYTVFYIPANEDVKEFHDNIGSYFSAFRVPGFSCDKGDVYVSEGMSSVYRMGIRCYVIEKPSIFNYNLPEIDITEDRIVKYYWQMEERIFRLISAIDDPRLITLFLSKITDKSYFESTPSGLTDVSFQDAPPVWDEMIKGTYYCPVEINGFVKDSERAMTNFVHHKIYTALEARFGKKILPPSLQGKGAVEYRVIEAGEHFTAKINKAIAFCKYAGINVDRYAVEVAEFSNKDVLARADDGFIVLSDRVLTMGMKQIVHSLIEEYLHLTTGARDETREFQEASLTLCTSLMERMTGEEL